MLRFALNILLLNLSYAFVLGIDAAPWSTAVLISLIVVSIYIEQGNMVVLSYVFLPTSLERKLFYPLLLFIQLLLVLIPSAIVGGTIFLWSHNEVFVGLGILVRTSGLVACFCFYQKR